MGTCHGALENGSPWASTHILGCWESIGVWLLDQDGEWGRNWVFVQPCSSPSPAELVEHPCTQSQCPVPALHSQFWLLPSARALQSHKACQWWRWRCSSAPPPFAATPVLRVCTGATEMIKHRSSFCCSCINPVLKYNLKWLKILLTEINFGWRTFDLRDSSFHFQIHYPILNYGFYYKSLFLHSL